MSKLREEFNLSISESVSLEMTIKDEIKRLDKLILDTIPDINNPEFSDVIKNGLKDTLKYLREKKQNLQTCLNRFT